MKIFSKIILKCIPDRLHKKLLNYYVNIKYSNKLLNDENFIDDFLRIKKYSVMSNSKSKDNLITLLVSYYHVIEKGFSMPDFRIGFGQSALIVLIDLIREYQHKIGDDDEQYLESIRIVNEYIDYHKKNNYVFDYTIEELLTAFLNEFGNKGYTKPYEFSSSDFYRSDSDFYNFSNSRHSLRNYDEKIVIDVDLINKALELCENTPSGCNRQPVKVFVVSDKRIISDVLRLHNGNRGFGHKADKLIVVGVTYKRGIGVDERNQVIVDGGIYVMNLLYALHYYKIGACPLNCNFSLDNARSLRKLLNADEDLVFISMVSLGYPPEKFTTPKSLRTNYNQYTNYI